MNTYIRIGLLLCLSSVLFVQCAKQKDLPLDMTGRWTTDNPSYKGEFIEISSRAIIYGSEQEGRFKYVIKKVESEKGPIYNSTLFRIYCVDESGGENLFTLIYKPEEGGSLRQKSTQDTVWKRVKS